MSVDGVDSTILHACRGAVDCGYDKCAHFEPHIRVAVCDLPCQHIDDGCDTCVSGVIDIKLDKWESRKLMEILNDVMSVDYAGKFVKDLRDTLSVFSHD